LAERLGATIEAEQATPAPDSAAPFDYSTIPRGHYDVAYRRSSGIQSKWHHLKFDRVARQVEGRRRILDVGCGPGTLLGALGEEHECVGVDITAKQIGYAQEVYGSATRSFYACSLEELATELGPFDAVTAVELIEHLPEDLARSTLETAVERLRPGGKLVVTTPNYRSAWPLVERMVDRLGDVEYYVQHINKLNRGSLGTLLEGIGLRDVEVRAYLAFAPFSAPLGWEFADRVARREAGPIENRLGLLLMGTGLRPG
jgi:SAM-dependent methyltransferase